MGPPSAYCDQKYADIDWHIVESSYFMPGDHVKSLVDIKDWKVEGSGALCPVERLKTLGTVLKEKDVFGNILVRFDGPRGPKGPLGPAGPLKESQLEKVGEVVWDLVANDRGCRTYDRPHCCYNCGSMYLRDEEFCRQCGKRRPQDFEKALHQSTLELRRVRDDRDDQVKGLQTNSATLQSENEALRQKIKALQQRLSECTAETVEDDADPRRPRTPLRQNGSPSRRLQQAAGAAAASATTAAPSAAGVASASPADIAVTLLPAEAAPAAAVPYVPSAPASAAAPFRPEGPPAAAPCEQMNTSATVEQGNMAPPQLSEARQASADAVINESAAEGNGPPPRPDTHTRRASADAVDNDAPPDDGGNGPPPRPDTHTRPASADAVDNDAPPDDGGPRTPEQIVVRTLEELPRTQGPLPEEAASSER